MNVQKDSLAQLDIRVVVLVGGRDFGRCPLAARLPPALWPIADQPVLQRLLNHLAAEGTKRAAVCCQRDVAEEVKTVSAGTGLEVTLVVEGMASGTAGCLRNAVAFDPGDLLVVLSGSMAAPPSLRELVQAHLAGGAELTMVFNPGQDYGSPCGSPAEIYLCKPGVLEHIPPGGYSDIKEGLIPSLLRAGGTIRPLVLDREVGGFRDRGGYLHALRVFFRDQVGDEKDRDGQERAAERLIRRGADTFVHPTARVCGPVVIADHAQILEDTVVIGPAMIGSNTILGESSVMIRSALWAGARVGAGCEICESVVGYGVRIADGLGVTGRVLAGGLSDARSPAPATGSMSRDVVGRAVERMSSYMDRLARRLPAWAPLSPRQLSYALGAAGIVLVFLWSYWPTCIDLLGVWRVSDEYSSGLLVPFLTLYVVWSRRQELASLSPRPALLWGVGAFLFAQAARGAGLYLMYLTAERLSLVLSVVALVLLLTGWRCLGKVSAILLFLCLMLPWPSPVQSLVALPLQRWATASAVFCLEVAGYEVLRDGNVIHVGHASVAVAEACNGLRMVTAFFVISGLVALLVKRAWWEKLVVLVSSLPIALLCNTLRLAITAVLFTFLEGEAWEQRFHDWGGYAMMPLALAMVVGELWLLARLTTPPMEMQPVIISRRQA